MKGRMNRDTFFKEENWYGSYYELCIELGETGNDTRLIEAMKCLWSQPQLRGGWWNRADFNTDAPQFEISEGFDRLRYGVIQLQNGFSVGCLMYVVREDNGSDWLDLCIPTGMLSLIFSINYPIYDVSNSWMDDVDQALIEIGTSIYKAHPFRLALIGEETSGLTHADSLSLDVLRYGRSLIPKSLWNSVSIDIPAMLIPPDLILTGVTQKT
jgi:hypothetical protein